MESLQEMMALVMARQAIEDGTDTFVQDLKRVAHRVYYGQNPETQDECLIRAAELYIDWEEAS